MSDDLIGSYECPGCHHRVISGHACPFCRLTTTPEAGAAAGDGGGMHTPNSSDLLGDLKTVRRLFSPGTFGQEVVSAAIARIHASKVRIRELEAQQQWRPIETAPKDGTEVLVAHFSTPASKWHGRRRVDWWRQKSDNQWYVGFGHFNDTYYPPTHWMPLPKEQPNGSGSDTAEGR